MKKYIVFALFTSGSILYSCGNAEEEAKRLLDSTIKDSTDRATLKKNTDDSIHMEDSMRIAAKKMRDDSKADSTHRADSMKNAGKKGK